MQELSLHVLDIAQNSVSASASNVKIAVEEDEGRVLLSVTVEDDGRGMDEETVKRVTDPFYTTRTTRKVGLGIPLFKMAAELTGGGLSIESEPGRGTRVTAVFTRSHIDRMPLGDMAESMAQLICLNDRIEITYEYVFNGRRFSVSTGELKAELCGVPLSSPEVMIFTREYIAENSKECQSPE